MYLLYSIHRLWSIKGYKAHAQGVIMNTVLPYKPNLVSKKVSKSCTHPNEKGGVGKTTILFHQAYRLAEKGFKVLVVDFDGQRNISKLFLGSMAEVAWVEKNGFTAADLFRPDLKNGDITLYKSSVHTNISIIPSHKEKIANILAAGVNAKNMVLNPKKYLDLIDVDFILIDTPPSLGVTQVAAMYAVDKIFVPVTVDDYSNEGFISLLNTLKVVKTNLRSKTELAGVYVNKFKKPSTRKGDNPYLDILNQIKRDYSSFLFPIFIPDSLPINEARMSARPCWINPPNGNAATVGRTVRKAIDALNEKLIS